MFNHPFVIGIIMAVLASVPLYLLSLWGYQFETVHFPLFLISLLVFFIGTAVWSARAAQAGAPRGGGQRFRAGGGSSGGSRARSPAPPPGNAQPRGPRETGTVKWFNVNKGFGFISREDGSDIFVHFRSIRGYGHRVLEEGQRVEFGVVMGEKGVQAHDVEILE